MYKNISITWTGDITSISGSAQHARRMLEPLIEGGAHVKLEPRNPSAPEVKLSSWWISSIEKLTQSAPGMVCINHGHPGQMRKNEIGGPTVLFTHWDTYKIPIQWEKPMAEYDEIWTPTRSMSASIQEVTGTPAKVLPFPLQDQDFSCSPVAEIDGIPPETFVFGAVGTWNNRRNFTDVITSYIGTFSSRENVALVIKTLAVNAFDPNSRASLLRVVATIKKGFNKQDIPKIVIIQDPLEDSAMDSVINRFNCFISASRCDNKNIAMMKTMAKGKPVIVPMLHANIDIINSMNIEKFKDYIYPIAHSAMPVMQMGNYYTANDFWANINLEQLMISMKKVYFNASDPGFGYSKHLIAAIRKNNSAYLLPDLIKDIQPSAIKSLV